MKTKRIKKTLIPALHTRGDAENAMNLLANIKAGERRIITDRDEAKLRIDERCAPQLAEIEATVKDLTNQLCAWAEANPGEFPKDRKSIVMQSGTLGFRTGTPKLALLNKKWNWKTALAAVQQWLPNFIRNAPEIDKEAILAQRDEPIIADAITRCGMKIDQDESFYVEPALSELPVRQIAKAA